LWIFFYYLGDLCRESCTGYKREGQITWKGIQPREEKAPGRPSSSLPVPEGTCKKAGEGLLTRVWSDRTRGDGFKLEKGRSRLYVRKKFFTMRVVRPWPRLPREAMSFPSLVVFKPRLDRALSNLV